MNLQSLNKTKTNYMQVHLNNLSNLLLKMDFLFIFIYIFVFFITFDSIEVIENICFQWKSDTLAMHLLKIKWTCYQSLYKIFIVCTLL